MAGISLMAHFAPESDCTACAEMAEMLEATFAEKFWVEDEAGRHPALALDAKKRPVTTDAKWFWDP